MGKSLEALTSLEPGLKVQGFVIFELPTDAEEQFLKYDPNPFATGDLFLMCRSARWGCGRLASNLRSERAKEQS